MDDRIFVSVSPPSATRNSFLNANFHRDPCVRKQSKSQEGGTMETEREIGVFTHQRTKSSLQQSTLNRQKHSLPFKLGFRMVVC
jgi:hypothetical protein